MNTRSEERGRVPHLPEWLDSRTAALIGTMLTVGVAIAALILASSSATRTEVQNVRTELGARIESVRNELLTEINALEVRVRAVELEVVAIRTTLGLATSHQPEADQHPAGETARPRSL